MMKVTGAKAKNKIKFPVAYASITIVVIVAAVVVLSTSLLPSLTSQTSFELGNHAADFELRELAGTETRKLSSHLNSGKPVLLNFWASWCPPCAEEMPLMQRFYDANKENVEFIGVNLQEDERVAKAWADERGITFPLLADPDAAVKKRYGVFTQPVSYFIDKNGVIVGKKFGPFTEQELIANLEKMLA